MRLLKNVIAPAALALVAWLYAGPAPAAEVRVLPATVVSDAGDAVSITVQADSASELAGFQFRFTYDPAVLEVTAIAVNQGFDRQFRKVFDNGTGAGVVAALVLNSQPLSATPLNLATIDFRAKGPGITNINIVNMVLGRQDGDGIPSAAYTGQVTVNAVPPPVSTITGTPASPTNQTGATFTIGGTDVVSYRYKLDNGLYSSETSTTAPVALAGLSDGTHTVSVIGRNAHGTWQEESSATTATWTVDTAAPVLALSTLADGSYTNNAVLNVAGTVTDASGVQSLLVSGATVTVAANGTFSHAITLSESANTVTVVATDAAGNAVTETRTITFDQTAPALAMTGPADNSKTNQLLSSVTGSVEAGTAVSISVNNGTAVPAIMNGTQFTYTATLAAGINTIDITAADLAGNTSSAKRTVTYDASAPSVAITIPAADTATNQATVTIGGTITDTLTPVTATITVDGVASALTLTSGSFSHAASLSTEGQHAITVTATDEAGNTATAQRNILYDRTAPALDAVVTSPTNSVNQIINGTREAENIVAVTCTTGSLGIVSYPTATTWSVSLTGLSEGVATVSITATDDAGNPATITRTIIVDVTSPVANINPAGGVYAATQSVALAMNETGTIYYSLDGTSPALTYSGPLTVSSTTTIKYRAVDGAGNQSAEGSAAFVIDTTAPALALTAPANGLVTNGASVTVSGSVMDGTGVQSVAVNGAAVTINPDNTFSRIVTLATGTNQITVTATDLAGNTATSGRTVILDQAAPVLALSMLADGSYTGNAVLNVAGTVTDNNVVQSLLVSGATVTVTANGTFSHAITLSEGTNTVTIVATDAAGNAATEIRAITLDQAAPALSIAGPADNSVTNQVVATITGTTNESSAVSVKLNNGVAEPALLSGNSFTAGVTLAPGINTIEITAVDGAGNTASAKRTVTHDSLAPSVAITLPNQDGVTTTADVLIRGTVTDVLSSVTLTISDGITTYVPPLIAGAFEQIITVPDEGLYALTATATDAAGNTASVTRNVRYAKYGDLDSDGDVDVVDALTALRIAAGIEVPSPAQLIRGDVAPLVNGMPQPDGKIDIGDVVVILRRSVGLANW